MPPLVGIELRNDVEQRIEVHVGHARVQQAVEALDHAVDFDLQLIGPSHGAVDRGVQGRRVSAGGQNGDAFHDLPFSMRAAILSPVLPVR